MLGEIFAGKFKKAYKKFGDFFSGPDAQAQEALITIKALWDLTILQGLLADRVVLTAEKINYIIKGKISEQVEYAEVIVVFSAGNRLEVHAINKQGHSLSCAAAVRECKHNEWDSVLSFQSLDQAGSEQQSAQLLSLVGAAFFESFFGHIDLVQGVTAIPTGDSVTLYFTKPLFGSVLAGSTIFGLQPANIVNLQAATLQDQSILVDTELFVPDNVREVLKFMTKILKNAK